MLRLSSSLLDYVGTTIKPNIFPHERVQPTEGFRVGWGNWPNDATTQAGHVAVYSRAFQKLLKGS